MKRLYIILLCALLALLYLSSALAGSTDHLPPEIRDYFSSSAFDGMSVLSTANGQEIGGRDACYFVLIRKANRENALYQFKLNNEGSWEYAYATNIAVPQTNHHIDIQIAYSGNEWPTDEYFNTPRLSIVQHDAGNEYPELCLTFELSEGKWLLHRVWSYINYDSMLIKEGSISYYRDIESAEIAGTAYGSIQRDLRYFSMSALPKTLKEAKSKLTAAPVLPAGDLTAQDIKFTGGQKYDVYSAPDKASLRGGSNKARVSTNGWIQVFGREDGWILIQYSIDKEQYRFGYISEKSLPKKAAVPDLDFARSAVYIANDVSATDDPLYSRAGLALLQEGTAVTLLARLGDDAYIEGQADGKTFRGFVPVNSIRAEKPEFAVFTDANGNTYGWFVITKLNYGDDHHVMSVDGYYERLATVEECEGPEKAPGSETSYPLADDFHADMVYSMYYDEIKNVPVTDLHQWYIDAYLDGSDYDGHELVFYSDLTKEEQETVNADFWFITTQIELNEMDEIKYMKYVYVPWG